MNITAIGIVMRTIVAIVFALFCSVPAVAAVAASEPTPALSTDMENQTKRQQRIARKVDRIAKRRGLDPLDDEVSEAIQIQHAIRTRNVGRLATTGGVSLIAVGTMSAVSGFSLYRSLCPSQPLMCLIIGIPVGLAVGGAGIVGIATGVGTTSAGLLVGKAGKNQLLDLGQSENLRKRDAPSAD